ncbi:MAG TPA: hypothetical protein VGI39_17440, partial [Polyangiaceae bacterium]
MGATGAAMLWVGVGCERLLAIDGTVTLRPEGGAPALAACDIAAGTDACQSCLARTCCSEATACSKNAACGGYENCLVPCGEDYVCRAQCEIANQGPEVVAERPTFDRCLVTNCEAECGVQSGIISTHAEPDAAAACLACVTTAGAAQTEACGRDVDCTWIQECVESCPTGDCFTACFIGRDVTLAATAASAASSCRDTCSVGSYWECLGREEPAPFTKARMNNVSTTIYDDTLNAVVEGAILKACEIDGFECNTAAASGTSDSSGNVTLSIPAKPGTLYGFNGYFDVSGAALYPTL